MAKDKFPIRLRYRQVELTTDVTEQELKQLIKLLNDPRLICLWRGNTQIFRGNEALERFREWSTKEWKLWFVIRHDQFGIAGVVFEYARVVEAGRTKFSILVRPDLILSCGIGAIASALFLDAVFKLVRIDNVFAEVYGGLNPQVIRALRSLERYTGHPIDESIVREYCHFDGVQEDFHIFRIPRSDWTAIRDAILR